MKILTFLNNADFKSIFALVFGLLSYLFHCIDIGIAILAIFMIFDYITGIAVVIKNKLVNGENSFDYKKGIFGAIKKLFYFMIIAVGFLLDYLIKYYSKFLSLDIETNGLIGSVVYFYFIGNEGLSLIDNWGKLGIPLPGVLSNLFSRFKNITISTNSTGNTDNNK